VVCVPGGQGWGVSSEVWVLLCWLLPNVEILSVERVSDV
jgi:hypothetical protein